MGVVSEIIPTFTQRRIYGYKAIVFSSLAIAGVGYLVWGHHMFTSGISVTARWLFSLLTFVVAVPSAIKVFNWVSTMYKGSINMQPPFLYVLGFIFLFMIGGMTGLINGALATDIQVHDTSFVVAHFHYIIFGGMGFAFFAALHYWFPKIYGRMYNIKQANIAFVIIFVAFNFLYFRNLFLDYGNAKKILRLFATISGLTCGSTLGGYVLAIGLISR